VTENGLTSGSDMGVVDLVLRCLIITTNPSNHKEAIYWNLSLYFVSVLLDMAGRNLVLVALVYYHLCHLVNV
jgi:hypothetical protein